MKKNLYTFIIISVSLLLLTKQSQSQTLFADSTFANNGILQIQVPPPSTSDAIPTNLLLQPDGKVIVGGWILGIGAPDFFNLMARFDICSGIPDPAFGDSGIVLHSFSYRNAGYAYALQADGKILCAGQQAPNTNGSEQWPVLCRYNTDGSPDLTFNGTAFNRLTFSGTGGDEFHTVIVLTDARILCTGFKFADGLGAMRFKPDGTLDSTFGTNGIALHTFASGVFRGGNGYILQDGRIIVTGIDNLSNHLAATAFDSTGTLDNTFGTAGEFIDNFTIDQPDMASAIQPNDKVVMAGYNYSTGEIIAIRLNTDGTLDNTFGTNGRTTMVIAVANADPVRGVTVLSNGKIMVMGELWTGGAYLARFNNDGSIDSTFGGTGHISNSHLISAALELANGELMVAGRNAGSQIYTVQRLTDQYMYQWLPQISQNGSQLIATGGAGAYQWYLNGNMISGATSTTYTYSQNGIYTVQLTDLIGCVFTSNQIVINVGIEEITAGNSMSIYPNPATDHLEFRLTSDSEKSDLEIFSLYGDRVMNKTISNDGKGNYSESLDISKLSSGIYLVKVANETGQQFKKFVKE